MKDRYCNSKGFLYIDNTGNVNENSLNKSLLHLSQYGNRRFSGNLINALKGFLLTDVYTNGPDVTKHYIRLILIFLRFLKDSV